tara:strand:+ start:110 stop:619 length:510 start_codon:yes stop_codon:yes gene_type:complete
MKSYALAALVATVAAQQENFNCVNPTGDDAWTTEAVADATDVATCGTLGTTAIEAVAEYTTFDWCLHAAVQSEVVEVTAAPDADPPVEGVTGVPVSFACAWFQKATAEPAGDIRASAPAANGMVYSAWAWGAGVALADAVAAAEDADADSAKMVASAVAAFATIAMVAY